MTDGRRRIDLSHAIEDGMETYPGLPGPIVCDYLSREASRRVYAPGTEFQIGVVTLCSNTGTYLDSPFHRYPDGIDISELPLEPARRPRRGRRRPPGARARARCRMRSPEIELAGPCGPRADGLAPPLADARLRRRRPSVPHRARRPSICAMQARRSSGSTR